MSIQLPQALQTNRFIAAELKPNTTDSESEIDLSSGIGSLSESTLNQILEGHNILTPRYDPYMNSSKNGHNYILKTLEYNNLPNNQNPNESNENRSFAIEIKKYTESPL